MNLSLQSILANGGPVVFILFAMSIVATAMVLMKFTQFAWLAWISPSRSVQALDHWHRDRGQEALKAIAQSRHPVDRILAITIRAGSGRVADHALLREEIGRLATKELERLRSLLRPLELIANLSPLLGLLGTVLGMIEAFQQLEAAGNRVDPALLSGGIWQALLTTAIGLSVAIPVVAAHGFLERQVDRIKSRMEDAVTQIFTSDLVAAARAVVLPLGDRLEVAPDAV